MDSKLVFLISLFAVFVLVLTLVLVFNRDREEPVVLQRVEKRVFVPDAAVSTQKSVIPKRIPKRIMQTYKNSFVQQRMKTAIQNVQRLHPGYVYEYFDDADARTFIKDHFDADVLRAFDSLIPGAYKADVFRLCYLYVHGGWYIDVSMDFDKDVGSIFRAIAERQPEKDISKIGLVVVRDDATDVTYVYQAFIGAAPKHPAIKFILDATVEKVLERDMCEDSLSITGPGMFGRALNRFLGNPANSKHHVDGVFRTEEIVMLRNKSRKLKLYDTVFNKTKYDKWRRDRSDSKHYSILYRKGNVFRAPDDGPHAKTTKTK